jgi:hypothetical protein
MKGKHVHFFKNLNPRLPDEPEIYLFSVEEERREPSLSIAARLAR